VRRCGKFFLNVTGFHFLVFLSLALNLVSSAWFCPRLQVIVLGFKSLSLISSLSIRSQLFRSHVLGLALVLEHKIFDNITGYHGLNGNSSFVLTLSKNQKLELKKRLTR